MKKFLIIVAALFVLVIAAAAPFMINWNNYKPRIKSTIADATGYEVNFGGDIDIALLPFPHVVVQNVGVKIPGAAGDIVTLKKAEVSVALMPLFSGEVNVTAVNLVEPVIALAVDKDGRKLWMTDKLQNPKDAQNAAIDTAAKKETTTGQRFALNKVEIENGTVIYSDAASGQKQTIEKINTTLSADTLAGPFKLKGDLVWNGQKIDTDIQTGKMDPSAQSVSLTATAKLSDGTMLHYAGVTGTAGGLDLQGETQIQSGNVSAAVTALSGKASTLPPVALNIQGLLTAKDTQADLKNLKFTLGDIQATGAVGIRNLKAQDGPALLTLDLASATPFQIETLMPVKSVKTVQAAPDKDVPKANAPKSYLQETLKLPMPLDIKATVKLAGVSYHGSDFNGVTIGLDKKAGVIAVTEDVGQIPGGGTLNAKTTLTFAAGSQAADKKGVLYTDPSLAYSIKTGSKAPAKLLAPFMTADALKVAQPMLKDPLSLSATGTVKGVRAGVDSGTLALGQTTLVLGPSSFTLDPTGKNDVALTISGENINLDTLMGIKPAQAAATPAETTSVQAPAAAKQSLQDTLKKLNLPVDLTVKANFKNITLQETTYAALAIDGGLTNNLLTLKTASMQDAQGNVMQAAGTVKDIQALSGVDMILSGKTSNANAFLSSLKVDTAKLPKDIGPLDLSVSLTGEKPESLAFNAKAKVMDADAQANGIIVNALSSKPGVDKLALHVTHPNFERLMQKFTPGYKAGVGINKNMDIAATVNLANDGYDVSGLTATLGSMTLTGTINAKTGGAKPDITANLNAGTLPLDILSGKDKAPAATEPGTSKTIASSTAADRWSHEAINTAFLNAVNLDLKLNAKSLEYGAWVLSNTVLAVTIKDGTLTIGQMDAGVYGGTMNLTSTVKAGAKQGEPITFATKADFKKVGLEPLAASFGGGKKLIKARGDVSLSLEAQSAGVSPALLIAGLTGKGQMDGKSVVLEGFDLAAMSRSLVSTGKVLDNITGLANASFSGGETSFDTIDGPFTIAQGNINFDNFVMKGAAATITNKGQISLPRWYVDMTSAIDLVEPADAPNLDMKFQGSLDNPGNTFGSGAMQNYIQGRVSKKLESVIEKKLGDKNPALNSLVNGLLGGNTVAPAAAVPAVTPPAAIATPTAAPAAVPVNDPTTAATPVETIQPPAPIAIPQSAPVATPETPAGKPTREEKINNVLQGILAH